jgi:hypothetical protein
MRIEVTDDAVMILDLTEEDRAHLQFLLRGAKGASLIIPRRPNTTSAALSEDEALSTMIDCMRTSAQDTLAALRARGVDLMRR